MCLFQRVLFRIWFLMFKHSEWLLLVDIHVYFLGCYGGYLCKQLWMTIISGLFYFKCLFLSAIYSWSVNISLIPGLTRWSFSLALKLFNMFLLHIFFVSLLFVPSMVCFLFQGKFSAILPLFSTNKGSSAGYCLNFFSDYSSPFRPSAVFNY